MYFTFDVRFMVAQSKVNKSGLAPLEVSIIVADQCYTLVFDEDELKLIAGVGDWDNSGKIPIP